MTDDISPIKIDVKLDGKEAKSVINKLINTVKAPFAYWAKSHSNYVEAKDEINALLVRARSVEPIADYLGISKSDAAMLVLRAEQREIHERIRHQKNIEDIINSAPQYLPEKVADRPVDEGWMLEFIDQCKNTTEKDIQELWSRILAGEVENPSSYSRRTLSCVRSLSTNDARAFRRFCQIVVSEDNLGLFTINPGKGKSLDEYGVSYQNLVELDACGLIRFDNEISGFRIGANQSIKIQYQDSEIYFVTKHADRDIRVKIIMLTSPGKELFQIVEKERNSKYEHALIDRLQERGLFQVTDVQDFLDIPAFLRRQAD